MAELDLARFAGALADRLRACGYSYSQAVEQWPETDRAMLSRAINRKPLSAANFLLLCRKAGLDPFDFLVAGKRRHVTLKSILDQAVTGGVSREAERAAIRPAPPSVLPDISPARGEIGQPRSAAP